MKISVDIMPLEATEHHIF